MISALVTLGVIVYGSVLNLQADISKYEVCTVHCSCHYLSVLVCLNRRQYLVDNVVVVDPDQFFRFVL